MGAVAGAVVLGGITWGASVYYQAIGRTGPGVDTIAAAVPLMFCVGALAGAIQAVVVESILRSAKRAQMRGVPQLPEGPLTPATGQGQVDGASEGHWAERPSAQIVQAALVRGVGIGVLPMLLCALVLATSPSRFSEDCLRVAALFFGVSAIFGLACGYERFFFRRVEVNEESIVLHVGPFGMGARVIPRRNVGQVEIRRSAYGRLASYGHVRLSLIDEKRPVRITFVQEPERWAELGRAVLPSRRRST